VIPCFDKEPIDIMKASSILTTLSFAGTVLGASLKLRDPEDVASDILGGEFTFLRKPSLSPFPNQASCPQSAKEINTDRQ
jgi:hypothetical protein